MAVAEQNEFKTATYARRGGVGTLILSGSVDIFEAQAVHAAARRVLSDTKAAAVCADLSRVERLDLSALQILCALRRELEAAGRSWSLRSPAAGAASLDWAGLFL